MMRCFSTYIGSGRFDPTVADVLPQLAVLDRSEPHPIADALFERLRDFVEAAVTRATTTDTKLRAEGSTLPTVTADAALQLLLQHRCSITAVPLSPTKNQFNTMSLDAIVPGQPHSEGDVQ